MKGIPTLDRSRFAVDVPAFRRDTCTGCTKDDPEGTAMTRLTASKAREDFADTLNRVAFGKERIVLHRRGKDLVALIPAEELKALERFLDSIEDRLDLEDAEAALADPRNKKTIPWKQIKRDLGL